MSTALPRLIEPLRLAEKGARLKGSVELSKMARLAPLLHEQEGEVGADILFSKNSEGIQCINGALRAQLTVLCQRCLEPLELPVYVELKLELTKTLAAEPSTQDNYEPLLVTAEPLSLVELLEDELLLALPISPMHPEGECAAAVTQHTVAYTKENPFTLLSNLKKR
jgi:uncharacterized protein